MIYVKKIDNQYLVVFLTMLFIIGIGFIDYISGYEISFSIFYLLPISLLALYRGVKIPAIIFVGLFAAATWGASEILALKAYSHFLIYFWNSFVRLVIFLSVGLLLYALKKKQLDLENYNSELSTLNTKIESINGQLSIEKDKSERLLTNILPSTIIEKLKDHKGLIADHHDECTVMFTDFKDFSILTKELSTEELVTELNYCFSAFDDIIAKYGLEKIKTIGDSYMCVGGITSTNEKSSIDVVLASMEIADFIENYRETRLAQNKRYFEIRIGMHTGQLIAGVVGKHKFAYDIWGDTVNYASRLESASLPGKINISQSTYNQVASYFDCTYRGKIDAKNIGETNMYFVDRIKDEFSSDSNGRIPNSTFSKIVNLVSA